MEGSKHRVSTGSLYNIREALRAEAIPENAAILQRFFKTGVGEYAEGDEFLGVRVPATRKLVPMTDELEETSIVELLRSRWHEERLLALLVMVRRYHRGGEVERARLWKLYLANTRWINNWDLVDSSAPGIPGRWVADHPRDLAVLSRLARSQDLWERRIAILATFEMTRRKEYSATLELSEALLHDEHDLIHKACGWMLREVGKRDENALGGFLSKHAETMPRTMLRYALEKLPPSERRRWMTRRDLAS
jgi:3-methyladenine DNA glycosylase AlkD